MKNSWELFEEDLCLYNYEIAEKLQQDLRFIILYDDILEKTL